MSIYVNKKEAMTRREILKENLTHAPEKCRHCGYKIFKYKASVRGNGTALFNAETGEVDYTDITSKLVFTPQTKLLYCANCSKRID